MYVIAYDVGTTGLKSCLFSIGKGQPITLVAGESENYDLYVLDNGGVEQDPNQWWDAMCVTTDRLLKRTGIHREEIEGISFCAQMQAVVLTDAEGNPVKNAMSYMDNRGKEQIEKLMRRGPKIAGMNAWKLLRSLQISGAVSGSVKDPVFKYRWVADNEPEILEKTHKWLDVKDYLVCRATGRFTMSMDSAFSTLLCDTRKGREGFSKAICRMMDVDMKHLPEIVLSTAQVGGITKKAAAELGLSEGMPVFSGGGDASLIGVGAGATELGDTHVYMGTSGWVCTIVDKQMLDIGSMTASISGADPERFNCFAELETAGKCLEWAKEQVGIDGADSYDALMERIKDVPAGSNGVLFTPWLHGNRNPFEDPDARGMFFNLGLEVTSADMIHAVIEGVCFHLRWQMTAMAKLTPPSEVIRFVGGGAQAAVTCQILADVLGRKVETVDSPQNAGSVGAAAIMAVGLGIFENLQEAKNSVPVAAAYTPRKECTAVYDELFETFKDLYKKNKKLFHKLNGNR